MALSSAVARTGRSGRSGHRGTAEAPLVWFGTRAAGEEPKSKYAPERSDEDQDSGDVPGGVDEDALESDDLDTDRVTSAEALSAAMRVTSMLLQAESARAEVS